MSRERNRIIEEIKASPSCGFLTKFVRRRLCGVECGPLRSPHGKTISLKSAWNVIRVNSFALKEYIYSLPKWFGIPLIMFLGEPSSFGWRCRKSSTPWIYRLLVWVFVNDAACLLLFFSFFGRNGSNESRKREEEIVWFAAHSKS